MVYAIRSIIPSDVSGYQGIYISVNKDEYNTLVYLDFPISDIPLDPDRAGLG